MILWPSYLHNGISYTGKTDIFILNLGPGGKIRYKDAILAVQEFPL